MHSNITDYVVEENGNLEWAETAVDLMGSFLLPGTATFGIFFNSLTIAVVLYMGVDNATLVYMILLAVGDSISIFIDGLLNIGFSFYNYLTR